MYDRSMDILHSKLNVHINALKSHCGSAGKLSTISFLHRPVG